MNGNQKYEKNKKLSQQAIAKIEQILESSQHPYEKKVALFNVVKNLELGEVESNEKKRTDCLLQGKFYNELAKQNLKEYKKLTIDALNK